MVSHKKFCHLNVCCCCLPRDSVFCLLLFCLLLFSIFFFFITSFQKFDCNEYIAWISLGLSSLFSQLSVSIGFCLFPDLVLFQPFFFFGQLFSNTLFFFSLFRTPMIIGLLLWSQRSPRIYSVSISLFSFFLRLGNFYCSIFMFMDFPLCPL